MTWGIYQTLDGAGVQLFVEVIPDNDLKPHTCGHTCWCQPELSEDGAWIHNSLDGREEFESGSRLVS